MAYFLRAFCTSRDLPPLREVFEWAESQGVHLQTTSDDLDARDWGQAEILYKAGRRPFVVEAETGATVEDEVNEFMELLDEADDSPAKQKVMGQLQRTKAVVAVQLLADIDEDGHAAAGTFLTYFVHRSGGLIQADDEGFYEGDRLVVDLSSRAAAGAASKSDGASMNVGFLDDERTWAVPHAALLALVAKLRGAGEKNIRASSGVPFAASDADLLADSLEIGVETEAVTQILDDRDRAAFRWALGAWLDEQAEAPDWAIELNEALTSS